MKVMNVAWFAAKMVSAVQQLAEGYKETGVPADKLIFRWRGSADGAGGQILLKNRPAQLI